MRWILIGLIALPLSAGVPAPADDIADLRARANHGDARAQVNLGYAYDAGQGVGQNYKRAHFWFRKAADQGYANVQLLVGVIYAKGHGVGREKHSSIYVVAKQFIYYERNKS